MKKLLSLIMALVMLFALSACGDEGKKDDKGSSDKAESSDVDSVTFKGLTFDINKELDFGGKTVKIARDRAPEPNVSDLWDRELEIKEYVEEKYNVKIEYVSYGGTGALRDAIVLDYISSAVYADLVFTTSPTLLSLLTNDGIFRPVDDYIDFENERFKLTSNATKYVDGKHYSYYPTTADQGYFVYYNTDLIADNNCEDPRELYESGNWNWEAFEKIAKACTGKDGGKDIFGIAGSNILDGLMASNGLPMLSSDGKGNVTCNIFSDAGKNALNFLKTLAYTDRAVDTTYGGHNGIETFNNARAAMIVGPQYYGNHFVKTGIPYEMVPLPMGPDTDSYTNVAQYCYCYSIMSTSTFKTEDLLQLAFELERNDPEIGDTYREDDYEGKLNAFIDQYVDQESHYFDDVQAEFVYEFINKDETVNAVDWITDDIKKVITEKVYRPVFKGEDVRSHLTSVKSVIENAIKEQFN